MNCKGRSITAVVFYFCLAMFFCFAVLQQSDIAWAVDDDGDLVDRNVHYGYSAGFNLDSSSTNNTCVGVEAGFQTGADNNVGIENTFIGDGAGRSNTSGDKNTCVGKSAGSANTTGNMNTFIGRGAAKLCQNGTESNVLVGDSCGEELGGNNNTFIGEDAGRKHTTGNENVFIGTNCGYNNIGTGNVFIGFDAGADVDFKVADNILIIDNSNTEYPLIYGDFEYNSLHIYGRLSTSEDIVCQSNITCYNDITCKICYLNSDQRWKTKIEPLDDSLAAIQKLAGVSYLWNQDDYPERAFDNGRQIGLIAQDVEKILPEVVKTDTEGYKSIAYSQIVPVLIEAVKSQQVIIEQQQKNLKTQRQSLQNQIDELRFMLEDLVGTRM